MLLSQLRRVALPWGTVGKRSSRSRGSSLRWHGGTRSSYITTVYILTRANAELEMRPNSDGSSKVMDVLHTFSPHPFPERHNTFPFWVSSSKVIFEWAYRSKYDWKRVEVEDETAAWFVSFISSVLQSPRGWIWSDEAKRLKKKHGEWPPGNIQKQWRHWLKVKKRARRCTCCVLEFGALSACR